MNKHVIFFIPSNKFIQTTSLPSIISSFVRRLGFNYIHLPQCLVVIIDHSLSRFLRIIQT
ncbi:unnamed protein product, partial [Vitis vinifera]